MCRIDRGRPGRRVLSNKEKRENVKQKNGPIHWNEITITVNGVEVSGSYSVNVTDWMTVRMAGGSSERARGGPAAESIARGILHELYAKANHSTP
jgi:hypothetical protein